ncbi:MAG: ribbon-helix-helix protein, CopG family, partial [Bacillota bacterium]
MNMISIRLPQELEEKLASLSASQRVTKSDIVKQALEDYFER